MKAGLHTALLVLPVQLIEAHPLLDKADTIFLVEHPRYFLDFAFHKKKLLFHRASMKAYEKSLKKKGYSVVYLESHEVPSNRKLFGLLKDKKIGTLLTLDPCDHYLSSSLRKDAKTHHIVLKVDPSPLFLTEEKDLKEEFDGKTHHFFTSFYINQRKRFQILLEKGKPKGGEVEL